MEHYRLGRGGLDLRMLKSEQARLDTFKKSVWSLTHPNIKDLAKCGFFCLEVSDKVQCAFCHGVAGEWEDTDIPLIEHRRHFPRCPLMCNLPVGNIPIDISTDDKTTQTGDDDDIVNTVNIKGQLRLVQEEINTHSDIPVTAQCKICFEEQIQIVFLPCAHAAVCIACSKSITKCVICTRECSKTRIFLA